MKDEFYVPAAEDVSPQSSDNKQGRAARPFERAEADAICQKLSAGQKAAYTEYTALLESGAARELARVNLPLSLYTELYWQIDLNNLFHFLELRLGAHAQKEIRVYAEVLLDVTKRVAPLAVESFERHIRGSVAFSKEEAAELARIYRESGAQSRLEGRARELFEAKLS
jgi:thymidylate synthase (FAD)